MGSTHREDSRPDDGKELVVAMAGPEEIQEESERANSEPRPKKKSKSSSKHSHGIPLQLRLEGVLNFCKSAQFLGVGSGRAWNRLEFFEFDEIDLNEECSAYWYVCIEKTRICVQSIHGTIRNRTWWGFVSARNSSPSNQRACRWSAVDEISIWFWTAWFLVMLSADQNYRFAVTSWIHNVSWYSTFSLAAAVVDTLWTGIQNNPFITISNPRQLTLCGSAIASRCSNISIQPAFLLQCANMQNVTTCKINSPNNKEGCQALSTLKLKFFFDSVSYLRKGVPRVFSVRIGIIFMQYRNTGEPSRREGGVSCSL